jgi:hypothetical protein
MAAHTTSIRVSPDSQRKARQLAQEAGLTVQQVVEQALEAYRRQQIFAATDVAYASLQADPKAWQEFETECREWDATLADGLPEY